MIEQLKALAKANKAWESEILHVLSLAQRGQTREDIAEFFASHPSLSKSGIAREAGISLSLLNYILNGQRPFTDNVKNVLFPVLNRYGGNFEV